jgi:hypothetical protein
MLGREISIRMRQERLYNLHMRGGLACGFLFLVMSACAVMHDGDDGILQRSDSDLSRANLVFAGTCDVQRMCGNASPGLQLGEVLWGCEGRGLCSDAELWVSAPSNGSFGFSQTGLCGRRVRLCRDGNCISARVRGRSSSSTRFEGSLGVMQALRINAAMTGACAGFGSAEVQISVD